MKVKLGKTYGDGSQDFIIEGMTNSMKENLIRLGMIKSIEDAVKQNADWLREVGQDKPSRLVCKGCRPDTCVGCGESDEK